MMRIALFLMAACSLGAQAEVTLPKIIGENMVLQRGRAVPIWGHAAPGETVTVRFAGQEKKATADSSGNWRVELRPLTASSTPASMTISGSNAIVLNNVLVGEVWLGSGQSNMEYPMGGFPAPERRAPTEPMWKEMAAANCPQLRLFKVEKVLSHPDVTSKGWQACDADTLRTFSAVAYYFGKELQHELDVPIGLIQSAWGGSRIEPWTPVSGYQAVPAFREQTAKDPVLIDNMKPGAYFESMVLPLAPFPIRGVIWYQGESNCVLEDMATYPEKMRALIDSWRTTWSSPALPFYYVQIAPYTYSARQVKHNPEVEPEFWEAQSRALQIPNTGMVVTTDLVTELNNIHPDNKWDVGHRLALWALAKDYGRKDLVYSGPVFKSMKVKGGRAELSFRYASDGLTSRDGKPLSDFTIAGEDGKFVAATATIQGKNVIVSSPEVAHPSAVRFAWTETSMPNLANKAGLPAAPFRTDSR
ncbi:MAG TPA: sialate O-acetylesterase [Bryobacteraceae bacterium]|nr:sialate O-acetylesterase [Bryobacteraceae bacterium]